MGQLSVKTVVTCTKVGAILWNCTDMKDMEVRHQFYPKGESSWCKYQRDHWRKNIKSQSQYSKVDP